MEHDIELNRALEKLRFQNQIAHKEFFGLLGTTIDGRSVIAPNSHQRGFTYELTPQEERPTIVWNFLNVFALFSDGHINYLPSFNEGRNTARDIKTNLVATYAINTKKEFVNFKEDVGKRIENLKKENVELKKRLGDLEKNKKN